MNPGLPLATVDQLDNGDGTYNVWMWNTNATEHRLIVTLENQPIAGSPFLFPIRPGPPSASQSKIVQTAASLANFQAGVARSVDIISRDQFGNLNYAGTANYKVRFSSGTDIGPKAGAGFKYSFDVVSTVAQSSSLFFQLNGVDISGSPVSPVTVAPGQCVGSNSLVTGAGLTGSVAGVPTDITVTVRDIVRSASNSCLWFRCACLHPLNRSCSCVSSTATFWMCRTRLPRPRSR